MVLRLAAIIANIVRITHAILLVVTCGFVRFEVSVFTTTTPAAVSGDSLTDTALRCDRGRGEERKADDECRELHVECFTNDRYRFLEQPECRGPFYGLRSGCTAILGCSQNVS